MRLFGLFIVCLLYHSAANAQNAGRNSILPNWLPGDWQMKVNNGIAYEIWQKTSKYELKCRSFFTNGVDTVENETVRLYSQNDSIFYEATVKGENKDLPVLFCQLKNTGAEIAFCNYKHDYPQIISYKLVSANSIVASISDSSRINVRQFPMTRSKSGKSR